MNLLVSIILPCYNMGKFLEKALSSIDQQTYGHWEVIIVDDHGPQDGTREIAERFFRSQPHRRVEFIRHSENQRLGATRNTGVQAAKGDLIAFLDPDDYWLPEHLAAHVDLHQKDTGLIVSSSSMEILVEDGLEGFPEVFQYSEWERSSFPASLAVRSRINPSAVVMKKEKFLAVGGFDTNPDLHMVEDYDLWFRLVNEGARFRILPDVTAVYRKHAGAATIPANRMLSQNRTQALAGKHFRQWLPSLAHCVFLLSERSGRLEQRLLRIEKSFGYRLQNAGRRLVRPVLGLFAKERKS